MRATPKIERKPAESIFSPLRQLSNIPRLQSSRARPPLRQAGQRPPPRAREGNTPPRGVTAGRRRAGPDPETPARRRPRPEPSRAVLLAASTGCETLGRRPEARAGALAGPAPKGRRRGPVRAGRARLFAAFPLRAARARPQPGRYFLRPGAFPPVAGRFSAIARPLGRPVPRGGAPLPRPAKAGAGGRTARHAPASGAAAGAAAAAAARVSTDGKRTVSTMASSIASQECTVSGPKIT